MAFNLEAVLTLEDRMSRKLKAVERSVGRLGDTFAEVERDAKGMSSGMARAAKQTDSLDSKSKKASASVSKIGDAISRSAQKAKGLGTVIQTAGSKMTGGLKGAVTGANNLAGGLRDASSHARTMTSNVFSLNGALVALAASYGLVQASKGVFNMTVGQAMQREASGVGIQAMIGDKKKSDAYQEYMIQKALDSPILNSGDMAAGSKQLIAVTRNARKGKFDQKLIEHMWDQIETLAAFAPDQGTEGATFAYKEMLTGSNVSMQERIGIKLPAGFSKLSTDKQIAQMDKILEKMGLGQKFVEDMGNTTLGKWSQIVEKFEYMMSKMGAPALEPLNKFFDDVNAKLESGELDGFIKWGGNAIAAVIKGLSGAAVSIYEWFQSLASSSEWVEKTTTYAKVSFIMDSIYDRFMDWLNESGKQKLEDISEVLISALAVGLEKALPTILPIAETVGVSVAKGVKKGFENAIKNSFSLNVLFGTPNSIQDFVEKENKAKKDAGKKTTTEKVKEFFGKGSSTKTSGMSMKNGGLDYVPYDGASYSLHKGEAILTRGEADVWRDNLRKNLRYKGGRGNAVAGSTQSGSTSLTFGDIHLHGSNNDNPAKFAKDFMHIVYEELKNAKEGGA